MSFSSAAESGSITHNENNTENHFQNLPARPPTPPRDLSIDVDDAFRFLENGHKSPEKKKKKKKLSASLSPSTDTPPPKSVSTLRNQASTASKRVEFSPSNTYHEIPDLRQSSSPKSRPQRQIRLHPPTKPLKSILKATTEELPLTPEDIQNRLGYFSPGEPDSFREMLRSVLQRLASSSRDERQDGYIAINSTLKHHEGTPDTQALLDQLGLLQQFITRDLVWKDDSGRLDSNIVTSAQNLTCSLLFIPAIAPSLDDDFRTFVVDRSIAALSQSDLPKSIMKGHMHMLAVQRFSSHIITPSRTDRLVSALANVEERCTGNSAVSARLSIYRRLLEQSSTTMLSKMSDWIGNIIHGMLSSIEDTRLRAIETCLQAAVILGTQAQAAKVLSEMLDRIIEKKEDGQNEVEDEIPATFGDYVNSRLLEMLEGKDAVFAPQIWSAVIMFFRCKRRPVDKWPRFKDWLLTVQKAMNHNSLEVKQNANIAWDRLVFTVMPDQSTPQSLRSMLKTPSEAGLLKRGNDKITQQQRNIAFDSYCRLIHYGLRPQLQAEELDEAWDLYIDRILPKLASSKSNIKHNAFRILHGMLSKKPGVWNETAVLQTEPIRPSELARLDVKWVRSRLGKMLKVFEPILLASMWTAPDSNKAVDSCWHLLLEAVAEAGVQEVKASIELKQAIAQLTNLFRRMWYASSPAPHGGDPTIWVQRYQQLLQSAINLLGAGHFVEDMLAKSGEDEIEAVPTPSHRTSKHPTAACSSFVFLFGLYYEPRGEVLTGRLYRESAAWFLQTLVSAKGSVSGSLGLLQRALQFSSQAKANEEVSACLWEVVAESAITLLQVESAPVAQRDVRIMGTAFRSALSILTNGLCHTEKSSECISKAMDLYSSTCKSARHFGNDGGVALGVMDPLAKTFVDMLDEVSIDVALRVGQALLEHGVWPKSRQELEQDRKALWVISLELPKTSIFDPFEHLYGCLNGIMARAYSSLSGSAASSANLMEFFKAYAEFLQKCPKPILPSALRNIQVGMVHWTEDRRRDLFPPQDRERRSGSNRLFVVIVDVWSNILRVIEKLTKKDSNLLQSLEPLLIAGFSSPSKEIVNRTITFWNETFGQEESLEYPSRIQPVLRARRNQTQLHLPTFPMDGPDAEIASLPAFADSQILSEALPASTLKSTPRIVPSATLKPPMENFLIKQHLAAQGLPYDHRNKDGISLTGNTPKAKLRHNDSQIEFAPIGSASSSASNKESQLLTDHQEEVRDRQKGDAQMFPDLSSSPAPASRTKRIAKKLDFTSDAARQNDEPAVATPNALTDTNPMSDDLLSSPTPRARSGIREESEIVQYSDDEETVCDPPSSPPRQDEASEPARESTPDDTIIVESSIVEPVTLNLIAPRPPISSPEKENTDADEVRPRSIVRSSDLPSDTQLPAAQLAREVAEAAEVDGRNSHITSIEAQVRTGEFDHVVESSVQAERSEESQRFENGDQTPSRIANSFSLEKEEDESGTPSGSHATSPKSQRSDKKRKRNSGKAQTSKKKSKPLPPFPPQKAIVQSQEEVENVPHELNSNALRPLSPFPPRKATVGSQEEDEPIPDDISDEIVVASSQHRMSLPLAVPVPEVSLPRPSLPPLPASRSRQLPKAPSTDNEDDQPVTGGRAKKRKRGRPSKSESQNFSQNDKTKPESLPRRASVMSRASTDEQPSTSVVKDTPAVSQRTRKVARISEQSSDAGTSSRRIATGVMLTPPAKRTLSSSANREEEHEDEMYDATPERQLVEEERVAIESRPKAQPKSLLKRLRGILADCKNLVFGTPAEERQFDDALFEIRREVHEAGRRLREQ